MKEFICNLCPRMCNVPRGKTGGGVCGMGAGVRIARAAPHYDEEPVISGTRGSGAVFFSGCSLKCRFCQNFDLSHNGYGADISVDRLRDIYFELIDQGVHNINLVNPTHYTEAILESLEGGLPVPVIWNSGGYERVETLKRLEGRVQVYVLDEDGIIRRGTIIRHLILPGCADESIRIIDYIAEHYPGAWISLMAQYLPFGDVQGVDELDRRLTQEEYDRVANHLIDIGLEDGFVQELSSSDEVYIPKFDLTGVEVQRSN